MPKQTYWNLPEEKRERFAGIALEEFARNDYASASVSRIVARAEIAKGSVYQYFEDKQDLFLYVLDRAQRTLLEAVSAGAPASHHGASRHDFFVLLRAQMDATVKSGAAHPLESTLVGRAYAGPLPFHDEVLERGRALRHERLSLMVADGVAHGELSPLLDVGVVTMVIESVVAELGPFLARRLVRWPSSATDVGQPSFESSEVEGVFDQVVAILRYGLGASNEASRVPGVKE